jgi:hypothetical protein
MKRIAFHLLRTFLVYLLVMTELPRDIRRAFLKVHKHYIGCTCMHCLDKAGVVHPVYCGCYWCMRKFGELELNQKGDVSHAQAGRLADYQTLTQEE